MTELTVPKLLVPDSAQLTELVEDSLASSTEKGITSCHLCVVGGQAFEGHLGHIHIVFLLKLPDWLLRNSLLFFLNSSSSHALLLEALTVAPTASSITFLFLTRIFLIAQVKVTFQVVFIEFIKRVPSF